MQSNMVFEYLWPGSVVPIVYTNISKPVDFNSLNVVLLADVNAKNLKYVLVFVL